MNMPSMVAAGIDVAKEQLDIAVHGCKQSWQVANTPEGFRDLLRLMRDHQVEQIGFEATGGYERDVVEFLRGERFTVVVLQPRQVRAYATMKLRHAKTDRIDAALIAAFTADHASVRDAPDPRLAALTERLTWLEQIEEDMARIKVRLEHIRDVEARRICKADLARLTQRRASAIARLLIALRQHDDLATRLKLVLSVEGRTPSPGLLARRPLPGERGAFSGVALKYSTTTRRRLVTSTTIASPISTAPAIIRSSASVAVFGSVTVCAAGDDQHRPLQPSPPASPHPPSPAAPVRRPHPRAAPPASGCCSRVRSPNTFSKSQPAGRFSGRSVTFSGSPSGRLGVLSTATRLVSRVTS